MASNIRCKYGAKCYRKNREHLEKFSHEVSETEEDEEVEKDSGPPKKKVRLDVDKANDAQPSASGDQSGTVAGKEDNTVATASKAKAGVSVNESDSNGEASDNSEATAPEANPSSPDDPKENIKSKFLVEMPKDFYEFWEFAKSVKPSSPSAAFASSLGLHLVGPYDVLAGKTKTANSKKKKPNYLRHWRYYYDPPEFLTVIKGDDKKQFHIGYYRDDPKEMPAFVASNSAADNCTIKPLGENLFAAVNSIIEEQLKKSSNDSLSDLQKQLQAWAKKCRLTLEKKTTKMQARDKKAVCRCFHGVGVVVPVDKNGVGHRPLPETQASLKSIMKKIADSVTEEERTSNFDPLMELVTFIQFANDECDYGEGLELGLDLFCYGGKVFHKTILNLLPLGYQLLGRPEYARVIEAHLADRRHSAQLSELD